MALRCPSRRIVGCWMLSSDVVAESGRRRGAARAIIIPAVPLARPSDRGGGRGMRPR